MASFLCLFVCVWRLLGRWFDEICDQNRPTSVDLLYCHQDDNQKMAGGVFKIWLSNDQVQATHRRQSIVARAC